MTTDNTNRFIKLKLAKPRNLKNDILSGLTVALALVPEAIAFAFIAGVDPRVGLYAAFLMGLVTSIFGGRPGMISGATGAVAVIFIKLVHDQNAIGGMESAMGYLFAAVIMMGLFQILFGVFRLGKFIRLVPHSVMLGFVNGLAIVIFRSQFEMFSVESLHANGPELFTLFNTSFNLQQIIVLLVMGLLILMTMAISYFLPKLTKAIPATLVALVVVTGLSLLLNSLGVEVRTILDFVKEKDPLKETLASGLPHFGIPAFPFIPSGWNSEAFSVTIEAFKTILPYSLMAAAVGLIESLMTLTLVDELTETRGQGNRECIGQGLANVVNGFFGGMGGCAMIGQSVINIRAGGRGRTSGIAASLSLLAFILFGAPIIERIPLAALVGVMFMVVIGTFEWSSLRLFRKIPVADVLVIIIVSAITVIFSNLALAVIVGIIFSAVVFAWEKGSKITYTQRVDEHGTHIYQLNGALFFGSVTSFKDIFNIKEDPIHVVIDFEKSRVHDHSGLEAINFIATKYAEQGKKLHLLNLSPECRSLLKKAESLVEVTVIEGLNWHLVEDSLAWKNKDEENLLEKVKKGMKVGRKK